MKHIVLILMFISSIYLLYCHPVFSKDTPTITDTIYTIDSLQGGFGYHIEANLYMGGSSMEEAIYVGDSYDQFTNSNVSERSFLSFSIQSSIPGYTIDQVILCLYQRYCWGNNGGPTFPIWYNGQDYPCIAARVDYGNSLEYTDFYPQDVNDIGIISDNNIQGWKQLDVTDAYLTDQVAGRPYMQFMLYFHILTDYDNLIDEIAFDDSHTTHPGCQPRLIVHYTSTVSNEDNTTPVCPILNVYPNPAFSVFTIKAAQGSTLNKVEIFNTKGERINAVSIRELSKSEAQIQLYRQQLPAGVYLVKSRLNGHSKPITTTNRILVY